MIPIEKQRDTKETSIRLQISPVDEPGYAPEIDLASGIAFMDHMLQAFATHGKWNLELHATGDIDVDPHHLIEDLGIVLGQAVASLQEQRGSTRRYGHSILPMDDALCETTVDLCNRPYLVYNTSWPQPYIGTLDTALFREFFYAFAANSRCNLHINVRYGENSHHIIEAMYKSFGIALHTAAEPTGMKAPPSTKGIL